MIFIVDEYYLVSLDGEYDVLIKVVEIKYSVDVDLWFVMVVNGLLVLLIGENGFEIIEV